MQALRATTSTRVSVAARAPRLSALERARRREAAADGPLVLRSAKLSSWARISIFIVDSFTATMPLCTAAPPAAPKPLLAEAPPLELAPAPASAPAPSATLRLSISICTRCSSMIFLYCDTCILTLVTFAVACSDGHRDVEVHARTRVQRHNGVETGASPLETRLPEMNSPSGAEGRAHTRRARAQARAGGGSCLGLDLLGAVGVLKGVVRVLVVVRARAERRDHHRACTSTGIDRMFTQESSAATSTLLVRAAFMWAWQVGSAGHRGATRVALPAPSQGMYEIRLGVAAGLACSSVRWECERGRGAAPHGSFRPASP